MGKGPIKAAIGSAITEDRLEVLKDILFLVLKKENKCTYMHKSAKYNRMWIRDIKSLPSATEHSNSSN